MMKIAILDDVQDVVRNLPCFSLLAEHDVKIFTHGARGLGQLAIRLAAFEVLVLNRAYTPMPRALLQKLPRLRLIVQTGELSEHIDWQAAAEQGITVLHGVDEPVAPAELTWTLIMAAMRKIPQYSMNLRDGLWQTVSSQSGLNTLGSSLQGKTLGVWGYGKIGQMVAGYGRAFGMRVVIWGSELSRLSAVANGYLAAENREHFFSQSDVVSLHVRLVEATRGIVLHSDLELMKPWALLVNTSRAELLQEGALMAAALRGQPLALDVFASEPLAVDSPLLRMTNVLATPHIGYMEQQNVENEFTLAFEKVLSYWRAKAHLPLGD